MIAAAAMTCKTIENQTVFTARPLVGGLIFFGNRFAVEAFLPVLDA
jgi:hypothetical protein